MKKIITTISLLILSIFAFAGKVSADTTRVPGNWYLQGNYSLEMKINGSNYYHNMIIDTTNTQNGDFTGHGWNSSDPNYKWNINGGITNSDIHFTIVYTGNNSGYTVYGTGNIDDNGYISGTGRDSDHNWLTWKFTNGTAFRFTGNHGQYVSQSSDKEMAAHSQIGMPTHTQRNH